MAALAVYRFYPDIRCRNSSNPGPSSPSSTAVRPTVAISSSADRPRISCPFPHARSMSVACRPNASQSSQWYEGDRHRACQEIECGRRHLRIWFEGK